MSLVAATEECNVSRILWRWWMLPTGQDKTTSSESCVFRYRYIVYLILETGPGSRYRDFGFRMIPSRSQLRSLFDLNQYYRWYPTHINCQCGAQMWMWHSIKSTTMYCQLIDHWISIIYYILLLLLLQFATTNCYLDYELYKI